MRLVSVDRLIEGLWGNEPPASAPKMIQLYVSQLRRLLVGEDAEIVTRGRGYELRVAEDAVDAVRFERLVAHAGANGGTRDGMAREALGLWKGPALADVADEPFAPAEIRRLDELRVRASELAIDLDLAEGRHAEVLADLERLVGQHPLRESLHARRMLALYRSGRQADALEVFSGARRRLVDELGVEPGAPLRELHERMLRQDPTLLPQPGAAAQQRLATPADRGERPVSRRLARRRRLLLAGAAVALLLAAGLYALGQMTSREGLARIDAGAVGVIDTRTGDIVAQYGLGRQLGTTLAGGGWVWVSSQDQGTLSRLRWGDDRVEVLNLGRGPGALAFGARALWVADEERGDILRVDPHSGRVLQRISAVGNGLRAIAVGDGSVWAATALDNTIVRLNAETGQVTTRIAVGGHPVALAVGAGAVWAAAEDDGAVVRVDPESNDSVDSIAVGDGPSAITVAFGTVWVANRQDGTVSRIDPTRDRVVATLSAGREPVALAAANHGLWIADANGAVRRLDPRTGTITTTVPTGASPAGLAAVGGRVWASAVAPAAAHRGGTLRWGQGFDDTNMDPAGAYVASYRRPLVYEGLLAFRRAPGAAGARVVGALAIDVPKATQAGRRYVFRLRRGLRYSDGTPVQADDLRPGLSAR
jgi:DNA-binding SARP family transcriptional activator/DNA-binding beta-propeller fold protein YncE